MITRLRVSSYKSLGDGIVVDLGRTTVLVGTNGSGKSNVADAIRFISDCLRVGIEAAITDRGSMLAVGRWTGGRRPVVLIGLDVEDGHGGTGSYDLRFESSERGRSFRIVEEAGSWRDASGHAAFSVIRGRWEGPEGLAPEITDRGLALPLVAADRRFRPLHALLRDTAVYAIFPDILRQPQRDDPTTPMLERGENWATTLRRLMTTERADDLRVALARVVGDVLDLDVETAGRFLVPRVKHRKPADATTRQDKWLSAGQESDGTLRVAGILTALLQVPTPSFIGIEEPELTVHPGVLPLLHDHLVEAAQRSQVLVTTHSPDLLDLFTSDVILVVERVEGTTTVEPLDATQRALVRDRLTSPGELLRVEGLYQAAH